MSINFNNSSRINTAAYASLLNTIAKGESGGNYNAHFGNSANRSIQFTEMTISEVFEWQDSHIKDGNVSNAVGKYQIIKPTLTELVEKLGVEQNVKFDKTLQDQMAIALIERRGSIEYIESKLTREEFAANLAKEWAALPRITGTNPDESYYSYDGINKSNISVDEVYGALHAFKSEATASL